MAWDCRALCRESIELQRKWGSRQDIERLIFYGGCGMDFHLRSFFLSLAQFLMDSSFFASLRIRNCRVRENRVSYSLLVFHHCFPRQERQRAKGAEGR